jgi:hypothetical protein
MPHKTCQVSLAIEHKARCLLISFSGRLKSQAKGGASAFLLVVIIAIPLEAGKLLCENISSFSLSYILTFSHSHILTLCGYRAEGEMPVAACRRQGFPQP